MRAPLLVDDHRKVAANDAIKIVGSHFDWDIVVGAIVLNLAEQVARMASPHGPVEGDEMCLDEVIDDLGSVVAPERLRTQLEQRVEFFDGGVTDFDFIGYPPQESIVHQIARLEVCRKDNELLERNLDLSPRCQG